MNNAVTSRPHTKRTRDRNSTCERARAASHTHERGSGTRWPPSKMAAVQTLFHDNTHPNTPPVCHFLSQSVLTPYTPPELADTHTGVVS